MRKALYAGVLSLAVASGTLVHGASIALAGAPPAKACGHNYDPVRTQNAITATGDPTRPWDDISGATNGANTTSPAGQAQAVFTLNLCGGVPDFASVIASSTAAEYIVCADANNPAITGSTPQTIALGHRGGPVKDGPYPPSQGYKFCTWANFQADPLGHTNTPTWGVAWYDPMGSFTFLDSSLLVYPVGGIPTASITPPSCNAGGPSCIGATSITLSLPLTWAWQVAGAAAPLHGTRKYEVETPFAAGSTILNIVALSQIAATVSLPAPVCPPNGVPVDCLQGIGGLVFTAGAFPADQNCTAPDACPTNNQQGYELGIVPAGYPIGAFVSPLCGQNPPFDGTCVWTDVGTSWTYYPCFGPGDSWPSGVPGQPGAPGTTNQDQGDVYTASAGAACSGPQPGTLVVQLPNSAVDVYGRIIPQQTVPGGPFGSPNPYHLWPQFLPTTWTD
jgi:hypothetical protein